MSIEAATDGAVFHAWLDQVLLPELQRNKPDAVLVMDNLAAHKTQAVRALLAASGFPYLYRPRYSADLGPIAVLTAMGTHQPDRARLGQAEGPVAQGRGTASRCPPCGPRPGACRHQQGRRPRLLPSCRLCLSQLACGSR
jgi:hypothetical protein